MDIQKQNNSYIIYPNIFIANLDKSDIRPINISENTKLYNWNYNNYI